MLQNTIPKKMRKDICAGRLFMMSLWDYYSFVQQLNKCTVLMVMLFSAKQIPC